MGLIRLIYPEKFKLREKLYIDTECYVAYWSAKTFMFCKRKNGWKNSHTIYADTSYKQTNVSLASNVIQIETEMTFRWLISNEAIKTDSA